MVGSGAAHELDGLVNSLKSTDLLRPVTVIGPSVYANLSLRHHFARTGLANLRFLVMPKLAELLGALALAGRKPLTPVLESASVRAVSAQASGMLGPIKDHPSTHQSLKTSFHQLRHASQEALMKLGLQGGLQKEVVDLFRSFQRHTDDYYDREDLARAAVTAIKSGSAFGLSDLGYIIFFQVREVSPAERDLMEALLSQGQGAALIGITGDLEADAPAQALASNLSSDRELEEAQSACSDASDTRLFFRHHR